MDDKQSAVRRIYEDNPILSLLLRNAVNRTGGVSPFTQPVERQDTKGAESSTDKENN